MATLTVRININNLADVLSVFNQIKVFRSDTLDAEGEPNNFVEITTPTTRINIQPDRPIYTFIDDNANLGAVTSQYTISYFNTTSLQESSQSAPSLGVPSPALDILSIDELKSIFLFGVDLTDDAGNPYPDALFAFYIESAVQFTKDRLDIELLPTIRLDERHDFYKQDYNKYVWIKTDLVPIISVQKVRLVLPTNVAVQDYDLDSIHVHKEAGQIEIVPGSGQITLGQTGAFLPLVFGGQDYLPQALRIDYTVGFEDKKIPADILEVIGMLASYGPFGIAGDLLVGAGIASTSLSLDGLSQTINTTSSATNSGYGARLVQYKGQLKEMWPVLYNRYHPRNFIIA